ncbi:hypothetical protein GSI_01445 [Ganoderma sinense ZZ0214-1]|uniref:Uncharacterized protein n=1 Tax=Ganoderma sinense ZZ0214-1 TaxID=1077348 RepID=A0A2G8SVF9_9APHY|nr:hypothetical protein GSI_01445 [Ganoderma sinense ZZ0214-1]
MPVFSNISSNTTSAAGRLSAAAAKAKAKAGPRLPRGATVVTGIKLSVTVATTLGLSVPYMKGISDAANEIMKYSDAMKANRKQCKRLAAEHEISIPMSLSLAELEWNLESIGKAMGQMRQESFVRRLLSKDEHAAQLVQHREDLQNALDKFKARLTRLEKKQDMRVGVYPGWSWTGDLTGAALMMTGGSDSEVSCDRALRTATYVDLI